nr:HAD hydrolase family protein [Lentilactobacillus rapi]
MPKGALKKRGIQELIKNANLDGIPTYAFGDGNNDIPMLDYVDHPVVMGNGLDRVKEYAEYITTKNSDHGIVNGLKHYDLL